jgi:four helix bundle protein
MKHYFKQLKIWETGMVLTDLVFEYSKKLPKDERYSLIQQMNRSSCSIPSNIAEGCAKRTDKHFGEFLSTALGSCHELETQLLICERRRYGDAEFLAKILKTVNEEQRMIFTFRDKLCQ